MRARAPTRRVAALRAGRPVGAVRRRAAQRGLAHPAGPSARVVARLRAVRWSRPPEAWLRAAPPAPRRAAARARLAAARVETQAQREGPHRPQLGMPLPPPTVPGARYSRRSARRPPAARWPSRWRRCSLLASLVGERALRRSMLSGSLRGLVAAIVLGIP